MSDLDLTRVCSLPLLIFIFVTQTVTMALMIVSTALSGVGNFVYTHSRRVHEACSRLIPNYETRESDDGVSRKRRRVKDPQVTGDPEQSSSSISTQTNTKSSEKSIRRSSSTGTQTDLETPEHSSQPSSNITEERHHPEAPRNTQPSPRNITYILGREPDSEVDNTSAIYKNSAILADVAQYIKREDSNYNIASAASANNDEEDTDLLDYLEMEASGLGMNRSGSANNKQRVPSGIASYINMDDSDRDMNRSGSANIKQRVPSGIASYINMDDSDQDMQYTASAKNKQRVPSGIASYINMDDSDRDMNRSGSANIKQRVPSGIASYINMDDSDQDMQYTVSAKNKQLVPSGIASCIKRDHTDQYIQHAGPAKNQRAPSGIVSCMKRNNSDRYIQHAGPAKNKQRVPSGIDVDDSDQDMQRFAKNTQRVPSGVAAYINMDDSDQDMQYASSANHKQQVASDIDAYLSMDGNDEDMKPTGSAIHNQQTISDIAAYIAKDDSSSSGDRSGLTVRFVEPKPEVDDPWSRPLVYNKKQPGPSPSVSSIGDIFEELGISPLDLNIGYEDDEPKIIWFDDDDDLNEFARGLSQRYRSSVRAGKQPEVAEPAPKPDPAGRIEELLALPSVETLKISDESKAEVESMQFKAAEVRLIDQQREKLNKERLLREQALQKLKERTSKGPRLPIVAPLSDEWIHKISETIELPDSEVVATTCQGTPLRRHDFVSVVAAKTWLNDEIVNGALAELEKQINLVAGITDYKEQGRKCLVMNSFFWPRVKEAGGKKTQSILRRMGVTPKNLLLMDTVLIPICQDYHWTLLVIQPKERKVMHLDSFNRRSSHPDLALAWMSDYLGDLYHAKPWQVMAVRSPQQTNGYDCGVHAITNGVCLALGLDPVKSYSVGEMALQRLRIAGMLLNGGFVGEFDLWQQ